MGGREWQRAVEAGTEGALLVVVVVVVVLLLAVLAVLVVVAIVVTLLPLPVLLQPMGWTLRWLPSKKTGRRRELEQQEVEQGGLWVDCQPPSATAAPPPLHRTPKLGPLHAPCLL